MPSILAIDISNTHVALALWQPDGSALHWQLATELRRTPDEYRVLVDQLCARDSVDCRAVDGVVMASVVPAVTSTFAMACRQLFGVAPLIVGPGVRSGLPIRTDDPREVGPDRIANAVAARARYGAPVIVLDFSTALILDVVDAKGDYVGAIIAPGLEVAADALAKRTARLHRIELVLPPSPIANNTEQSLQSGLVLGYVGLVQGLVARLQAEIGPARVVATGDGPWVPGFVAATQVVDAYDPLLTLDGLRQIYAIQERRE